MAKNVAGAARAAEKSEDEQKKDGALVASGPTAAELAAIQEEMVGSEGAGTSAAADDNIVPFLVLLQDGNPEVKKREDAYVEGAEPGFLINKATKQLWHKDEGTGYYVDAEGRPLEVQPCAFQRAIVEWVPRNDGGGFVERHPFSKPTAEENMQAIGGKQMPDPRDTSGRKMMWRRGPNDLIDTRYHFVNIMHEDRLEPVVMAFSSTGHTPSRAWMTLMRNTRLRGVVAPSWFGKYRVRPVERKNNQGSWFILGMESAGFVLDAGARRSGKELYESVSSGAVRADADVSASAGGGEDVPI